MDNKLDEAIDLLEELKTRQSPPDPRIFDQLDKLYELRHEIVELHIEKATADYASAAAALDDVISEGKEALQATGKIASTLRKFDSAIGQLKRLTDTVR